jgi:hypothetical protein
MSNYITRWVIGPAVESSAFFLPRINAPLHPGHGMGNGVALNVEIFFVQIVGIFLLHMPPPSTRLGTDREIVLYQGEHHGNL